MLPHIAKWVHRKIDAGLHNHFDTAQTASAVSATVLSQSKGTVN